MTIFLEFCSVLSNSNRMKKIRQFEGILKIAAGSAEVLQEGRLHVRAVQCTRKWHYTQIFTRKAHGNRNAAVPKPEVLICSPISSRLGDGDTGSTYIFICAKEEDYKRAWGTACRHFYKLKSL